MELKLNSVEVSGAMEVVVKAVPLTVVSGKEELKEEVSGPSEVVVKTVPVTVVSGKEEETEVEVKTPSVVAVTVVSGMKEEDQEVKASVLTTGEVEE